MKKARIAALAIVAMVGCSDDNSQMEVVDPSGSVAAVFSAAEITRVADSEWQTDDKIGISMTEKGYETLADGDYENVAYTVYGEIAPVSEVIYLPIDGTEVDFYAYYPHDDTAYDGGDIAVNVTTQTFEDIDLLRAKFSGASEEDPTVSFTGDNSFTHQLSKLIMEIEKGDGVTSLAGLETTIKGQYTTATYNIYSDALTVGSTGEITAVTAANGESVEAILIPTAAIDGSTIVFELDGGTYTLDTSAFEFAEGCEYTYKITLAKSGAVVSGATIGDWGTGGEVADDGTAELLPPIPYLELVGDVYQINSAAGLWEFARIVNEENLSANGLLTTNVDLGCDASNPWIPMGSADGTAYSGVFDGGGHLVSGLYINSDDGSLQGFFGYTQSAAIMNLGVAGTITGASEVGGIVGQAMTTTIYNCYNLADITATGSDISVGGIAGYASDRTVTNCYNRGDITATGSGTLYVGGLLGYTSSTVTACYSSGSVSSTDSSNLGGVIGDAKFTDCITYCYYDSGVCASNTYLLGAVGNTNSGDDTKYKSITTDLMKGDVTTTGSLLYYFNDGGFGDNWIYQENDYPILSTQNQ